MISDLDWTYLAKILGGVVLAPVLIGIAIFMTLNGVDHAGWVAAMGVWEWICFQFPPSETLRRIKEDRT